MLKKVFLLSVICISLCGCGTNKTVAPILENISFTAEVEYCGQKFSCETVLLENDAKITVLNPEEIKGLVLEYKKGTVSGNFYGVAFVPDADHFPLNSVPQLLYNTVCDIKDNKTNANFNSDNCEIKGMLGGNDYVLIFSPSGLPISLEFSDLELRLQFNNIQLSPT